MRAIKHEIAGKTVYLVLTGDAHYDIAEKYGSVQTLIQKMDNGTKEGFITTCEVAALLAEQGELARRFYGYEKQDILSAETIRLMVQPSDIPVLAGAILNAIAAGFGREVKDENESVDLGLIELEDQKKTAQPGRIT